MIPFLMIPTRPYDAGCDVDGDDFEGTTCGGRDCDDRNPAIFPGAPEICEDGIDQDCNAVDISCAPGKDRDVPPSRLPDPAGLK